MSENAQVKRLRRWANERGLTVHKSRVRYSEHADYGRYQLLSDKSGFSYRGPGTWSSDTGRFRLTLDDIERHLGRS